MPRTIRIKVYKFNELSKKSQERAIEETRVHRGIAGQSRAFYSDEAVIDLYINVYDYDFTKEGYIFH